MALHIKTDSELDEALDWLSHTEKRSKSDVVRDSVLARYRARKGGFELGALRHLMRPEDDSASVARELKEMDDDRDLD
jgi:predicted transcriptional regulator